MANNPNEPMNGSAEPKDLDVFLLAFEEAAARRGLTIVRWLDDASVECRDQDGETATLSLHNLYRSCSRHNRADWPDIIEHFLQNIEAPDENEAPDDLNAVADQLLPRLGPPLSAHDAETRIWWKKLDPERIWLNLVIDYPTRMLYVTRELVDKSGQSGEHWLSRALDNLRGRSSPEMVAVVNEEIGMRLVATEDSYDAARALILDTLLPQTQQAGCFVAPIGRDQLLVLPVAVDTLPYVHILKLLARDNHPTTPYAISDEVFWVWRGEWRLFPIDIEGESITVRPPDEFVEALNSLVSEDEDGED